MEGTLPDAAHPPKDPTGPGVTQQGFQVQQNPYTTNGWGGHLEDSLTVRENKKTIEAHARQRMSSVP